MSGDLVRAADVRHLPVAQQEHVVTRYLEQARDRLSAVEVINSGKGGKKLPSWWKSEAA